MTRNVADALEASGQMVVEAQSAAMWRQHVRELQEREHAALMARYAPPAEPDRYATLPVDAWWWESP